MAKKKITVNIEGKVWDAFKQVAWRSQLEAGQNLSVSQYLENMISVKLTLPVSERDYPKPVVEISKNPDIEADKKNSEYGLLQMQPLEELEKVYETDETPTAHLDKEDLTESELEQANNRLKEKRKAAKKERPKKLIKTVEEASVWAGGFSKDKQLGKKAKQVGKK